MGLFCGFNAAIHEASDLQRVPIIFFYYFKIVYIIIYYDIACLVINLCLTLL